MGAKPIHLRRFLSQSGDSLTVIPDKVTPEYRGHALYFLLQPKFLNRFIIGP
jgi:hypothetical protein